MITVPESAVEFSGDSTFVYLLTAEQPVRQFKRHPVKIGMSDGLNIAIENGLTVKDKVRGIEIQPQ